MPDDAAPSPEPTLEPAPEPTSVPPAEMERRAFVRRMTNDTVGLAGRVFGLSRAMTRGAVAAGQAVREQVQAVAVEQGASEPPIEIESAAAPAPEPVIQPPDEPETVITPEPEPAPVPQSRPEPGVQLTADQAEVLAAATSAILAVNGRDSPPLAQPVAIHWDGETLRFGSLGWSRRATAVQMEPRVTLVVEAVGSDGFVVVEGMATFVIGPAARDAMAPLLGRGGDQDEADRRWAELIATDPDRVAVLVRPTKVLTGRRS